MRPLIHLMYRRDPLSILAQCYLQLDQVVALISNLRAIVGVSIRFWTLINRLFPY